MIKRLFCFIFILFFVPFVFADSGVNLILTKGVDKATPVAVVPFENQSQAGQGDNNIAGVIASDLRFSGLFKVTDFDALPAFPHNSASVDKALFRKANTEDVVVGSVNVQGDRAKVYFALVDLVKSTTPQVLLEKSYDVPTNQLRALSHHIADLVFQQLTGVKGVFSTRIAYVQVRNSGSNPSYSLNISDADGFNPRAILVSSEPIMSPAWSPDGKSLAYVSFEGKRAQIYIANIASGARRVVSQAPGINGAPAFSADGRQLAVVLSKTGMPKIYLLSLSDGSLRSLTSGRSIDTEPNFAPDGKSMIFTSDRGGSPQIYRLWLGNNKVDRVTYSGDYNARGSFSSDGKTIAMIHRENGQYNIAVQDMTSGTVSVLTNSGRDDSPSLAPNGLMVLYGNEYGELGIVTVDGRVKLRVPGKGGKVQDPAWSPFL